MNQKTYTHCEVQCLLRDYAAIDQARRNEDKLWNTFRKAVAIRAEQEEEYSDEGDTSTIINKMADDMNSYSELIEVWHTLQEIFNYKPNTSIS